MGIFSKKDSIPEIPTAPGLPELPRVADMPEKRALPELPSFPNNPKNESFNQQMVKSAVSDQGEPVSEAALPELSPISLPNAPTLPTLPTLATPEIPEVSGMQPSSFSPEKVEIPELPTSALSPNAPEGYVDSISSKMIVEEPEPTLEPSAQVPVVAPKLASSPKSDDPIFVRIDKFQASQENFDEIKTGISDIQSVLRKIKEVKEREEEELKGWTADVEKIKLKLAEIDTDIFSQI